MKSKLLFFLLLFAFGASSVHAQYKFEKTYGGGGPEEGFSVRQTLDGGYIMVGYTQTFGVNGYDDVYLVKTDAKGDTLWTKTYGGAVYEEGFSVEQTSDSGFVITGMSNSFTAELENVYLIKTDKNGTPTWSDTYGGNLGGTGRSVKPTNDGGFIICGTKVNSGGIHDIVLIKVAVWGDTLWTRTYGGSGDDYGFSVVETYDKGYMMTGGGSTTGVYLIRTDVNGDTLWTKTAYTVGGPPHLNIGYNIEQTADSGFIISGTTDGGSSMDMYVLKTDKAGNTQWEKTYSGSSNDYAMSIQQTFDGGYIMGGWSQSFSGYHSVVIRLDETGDTLWTRIFNGGGTSYGYSVRQTADSGFVFLATAVQDMYLVKMDANGNTGCNQGFAPAVITSVTHVPTSFTTISSGGTFSIPPNVVKGGGTVTTLCSDVGIRALSTDHSFSVSPNPFANEFKITGDKPGEYILYDITGKEILRQKISKAETTVNTEKISSGFYCWAIAMELKPRILN